MLRILTGTLLFGGALADSEVSTAWNNFKTTFSKKYTAVEELKRIAIFKRNYVEMQALNQEVAGADFGVTKFSDLSPTEFKAKFLTYRPSIKYYDLLDDLNDRAYANSSCTDTACDWASQGAVSKPRDQGECGSCWAFSTAEQIASDNFLAGNKLVELSPQQIVDCVAEDNGCDGGDPTDAYPYIVKKGLETEQAYPYKGQNERCKYKASNARVSITDFSFVIPQCTAGACKGQTAHVSKLKDYLKKNGPASICVNAEPWQSYTGGVFDSKRRCSGAASKLDHCVQLTGYGQTAAGKDYWVVRNSWGLDWGLGGYIHIAMGNNLCGVLDEVTVTTIKK